MPLRLIFVGRSDGVCTATVGKARKQQPNEPTPEQMRRTEDTAKGVTSYYREVPIEDPKNLDWRKKLGGMLVEDVQKELRKRGKQPSSGIASKSAIEEVIHALAAFPESYRLYEHRRTITDAAKAKTADQTGKKGERRDVYLYGHPKGRKKRYRSPGDFYPHLFWLALGQTGEHDECKCKLCTTDEVVRAAKEMKIIQRKLFNIESKAEEGAEEERSTKATTPKPRKKSVSTVPTNVQVLTTAQASLGAPAQQTGSTTQSNATGNNSTSASYSGPSIISPPHANSLLPTPTPLKPPQHPEQHIDQQIDAFVYRNGELVWYHRLETGALALGAVISRALYKNQEGKQKAAYLVQPVSHPFHHPPGLITTQENGLMPWLAFSMPHCQLPDLRDTRMSYNEIDWTRIARDYQGTDLLHDASITAARTVDCTYTMIGQLPAASATEMEYIGMWLGCEQMWVGEAIRLSTGAGKEIMIVSQILESKLPNGAPAVYVVGDIYELTTKPLGTRTPPRNHALPKRVWEDLKYRNQYCMEHKRVMSWTFIRANDRVPISSIKGRWYESRHVLPSTQPERLREGEIIGDIPDVGDFFNAHGGLFPPGGMAVKKNHRRETFYSSLPDGVQFGMNFPLPQPGQPPSMPINLGLIVPQAGRNMMSSEFVSDGGDPLDQGQFNQLFMG